MVAHSLPRSPIQANNLEQKNVLRVLPLIYANVTICPRNIKLTSYSITIAQLKLILHHNVQPLALMPVPQSQVKSSEACSKTLQ